MRPVEEMLASAISVDTPVLIVGAGPIGLALAIELARSGVACTIVEQNTAPSTDPKAKYVNLRTMGLLRRWGIADLVRAAAPIPQSYPSDVVYANRLTGRETARLIDAFSTAPRRNPLYPEPAQRIPQPIFQDALRQHAVSLPTVTLRDGVRLETLRQMDDCVEAVLVDVGTGRTESVTASYLAGCDGGRSTVRRQLGIRMEGTARVAHSLGATFRAPELRAHITLGDAVHYWVRNDELPIMVGIGPLDLDGLWFFQMMDLPEGFDAAAIDPRRILTACVGHKIAMEVIDVTPWQIHKMTADRYRERRAFILGDAAHLHSPTGGFGMNTGIGDAIDLGWKLGAVLGGWGADALLDTFETERRPIHDLVIRQSASNLASQKIPELGEDDLSPEGEARRRALSENIVRTKTEHYRSIGLQLGYRYDASPLIAAETTPPPAIDVTTHAPTARPGAIAPHAWLADGRSLFDLFGAGFTLLDLSEHGTDVSQLEEAAATRSIPLTIVRLADTELRALYQARLVLIRPDQHVAWRAETAPEDAQQLIDLVRGASVQVVSVERMRGAG